MIEPDKLTHMEKGLDLDNNEKDVINRLSFEEFEKEAIKFGLTSVSMHSLIDSYTNKVLREFYNKYLNVDSTVSKTKEIDKLEIYKWLKKQNYQTFYDEIGEYKGYYDLDMPKIINDFIRQLSKKDEFISDNNKLIIPSEDEIYNKPKKDFHSTVDKEVFEAGAKWYRDELLKRNPNLK